MPEAGLPQQAFFWGLASALSLPLGSALGLWWKPGPRINSAFMAFGAGALLFALTIELMGEVPEHSAEHGAGALAAAVGGAVVGGLLFALLNYLLNEQGAFLRNWSNAREYVARLKRGRSKKMVRHLAQHPALAALPPRLLAELVQRVDVRRFDAGDLVFDQGDVSDEVYFIVRGRVQRHQPDGSAMLVPGDLFGVRDVLEKQPRSSKAQALDDVTFYVLQSEDFEEFLRRATTLREVLNSGRAEEAARAMEEMNVAAEEEEIDEEVARGCSAQGAALAIWMGIGIDAVPESLVIGMLAVGAEGMSLALVAGVFLANMPEAMSSSVTMRRAGMGRARILLMWLSLCLLTGLGALIGAVAFPAEPQGAMFYWVLAIEAMAAGAMLTMIAETMLPEAFEQGGSLVGLTTLAGFLAALSVAALK